MTAAVTMNSDSIVPYKNTKLLQGFLENEAISFMGFFFFFINIIVE